jgi:hypothetical protein
MMHFDKMSQAQRNAYANTLELEWHLNYVPGVKAKQTRHIVVVSTRPAPVFW